MIAPYGGSSFAISSAASLCNGARPETSDSQFSQQSFFSQISATPSDQLHSLSLMSAAPGGSCRVPLIDADGESKGEGEGEGEDEGRSKGGSEGGASSGTSSDVVTGGNERGAEGNARDPDADTDLLSMAEGQPDHLGRLSGEAEGEVRTEAEAEVRAGAGAEPEGKLQLSVSAGESEAASRSAASTVID